MRRQALTVFVGELYTHHSSMCPDTALPRHVWERFWTFDFFLTVAHWGVTGWVLAGQKSSEPMSYR